MSGDADDDGYGEGSDKSSDEHRRELARTVLGIAILVLVAL